jgi:hypothetical protein
MDNVRSHVPTPRDDLDVSRPVGATTTIRDCIGQE